MSTLSLRVAYRPLRIGWCIRSGDKDQLREVLRLTHALWGGRYNPVIPVDEEGFAKHLVDIFQVDALYPASEDQVIRDFIRRFPYLPWPLFSSDLFSESADGRMPALLDVSHAIRRIYEDRRHVPSQVLATDSPIRFVWKQDDPLRDAFLTMFGAFPAVEVCGRDYGMILQHYYPVSLAVLDKDQPLDVDSFARFSVSDVTGYGLQSESWLISNWSGLYVGDVREFDDLVSFWNLRAAGHSIFFYDPNHAQRMSLVRDRYLSELRGQLQQAGGRGQEPTIWIRMPSDDVDLSQFGQPIVVCPIDERTWGRPAIGQSLMFFERQSTLGSVAEEGHAPELTFQLPSKPFSTDDPDLFRQHFVASIRPLGDSFSGEQATFHTPFIPELNEYLGRQIYFMWNRARAEIDGLGIVISCTDDHLSLRAHIGRELVSELFAAFRMKAEPSQAGRVTSQLILQMGGIQGCRVFKIRGVRELIEKYEPDESFTRSNAIQVIGQNDPSTGKPNFSEYEDLYIEYRTGPALKPQDAFANLLKNGVFRVGLKLSCPSCVLESWLSLDDVRTIVECPYCGNKFNISTQLRDRDWAYRRSGLFGRRDHQEGGIPVALALQQLNAILGINPMTYVTGTTIDPKIASVNKCETDIIVLTRDRLGQTQLVIGECKSRHEITKQDVENLTKVADAFPAQRISTFIVFSKLSPFSPEEIQRCAAAQNPRRRRVILLTERELEPQTVYMRAAQEFDVRESAISLEEMAEATDRIYFNPKRKQVT